MGQDRSAADHLNDHLDAAAAGDATRSHALDPAILATVERFFAADDAPGLPPGFADHLWRELIHETTSVEIVPLIPALHPERNGRTPIGLRHTTLPNRGPSALAYFATAALVLLTLVGGFVGLRGSLRLMNSEQRVIIPAIDSTAESKIPTGSIADVILLRAALEQMPSPQGRSPQLALNRYRLARERYNPLAARRTPAWASTCSRSRRANSRSRPMRPSSSPVRSRIRRRRRVSSSREQPSSLIRVTSSTRPTA